MFSIALRNAFEGLQVATPMAPFASIIWSRFNGSPALPRWTLSLRPPTGLVGSPLDGSKVRPPFESVKESPCPVGAKVGGARLRTSRLPRNFQADISECCRLPAGRGKIPIPTFSADPRPAARCFAGMIHRRTVSANSATEGCADSSSAIRLELTPEMIRP
jgi:hypothetical protein